MSAQITSKVTLRGRLPSLVLVAGALLSPAPGRAAAPGITSNTATAGSFALTAQNAYLNQPDGNQVYAWGYGCVANSVATFRPTMPNQACSTMQVPGPTLIVTEGQAVDSGIHLRELEQVFPVVTTVGRVVRRRREAIVMLTPMDFGCQIGRMQPACAGCGDSRREHDNGAVQAHLDLEVALRATVIGAGARGGSNKAVRH